MMLLVHSSPTTLEPYRCDELGVLCSPRRVYGAEMNGWPWAADNDAFSSWDEKRYFAMLDKIKGREGCLFVTAPDVVGDHRTTFRWFMQWQPTLAEVGQPVAFVAQDGCERPPWEFIDALFIGGTTEFKMGSVAASLVVEAKRQSLHVHMGRVNGHRRLMYAKALGCDSVDGTSLTWFRDTHLPDFLRHAAQPPQMLLQ